MNKNFLGPLISIIFLAGLIFLMRDEVPQILSVLKSADHGLILISALIFLSTALILAKRLQMIFGAEGIPIRMSETTSLTFVGYFFNNFLPTAVGGDVVKAMCAAKVTKEPVISVTTVMMDRIFGLFTFVLIPSISLLFLSEGINPQVRLLVYFFLCVSCSFFVFLFNRGLARRFSFVERLLDRVKLGSKARKIYDGLHNFKNHKGLVALAMLLSVFGQSIGILVVYLIAVALGAEKNTLIYFFLLVPVVQLVSMLPSLNGLGIREGAYIYFLKSYIGTERAVAIGLISLAFLFLASLIGGLIYFLRRDYHIQFKKAQAEAT